MKAFNKKKKRKHTPKVKNSLSFKNIRTKEDLYLLLNRAGKKWAMTRFIDSDGDVDFAILCDWSEYAKGRLWYSQEVVGGYIEYDYTVEGHKYFGNSLTVIGDKMYELDCFPTFQDFIKFPIKNMTFPTEREVIVERLKQKYPSFFDSLVGTKS